MTDVSRLTAEQMAILKAYVDLANSERQAIWARNAALLVANSIILNVVAAGKLQPATAFSFLGVVLCIVWIVMTFEGWRILHSHNAKLYKLSTDVGVEYFNHVNRGHKNDLTRACTLGIILIVLTMHMILAVQNFQTL